MCSFSYFLFLNYSKRLVMRLTLPLQSCILTHSLSLLCTDEILRSSLDLDIGENDLRFDLSLHVLGSMHDDLCGSSWGSHHRCTLGNLYRLKLSSFLRTSLSFRSEIGSKKCNFRETETITFYFRQPQDGGFAGIFIDGPLVLKNYQGSELFFGKYSLFS